MAIPTIDFAQMSDGEFEQFQGQIAAERQRRDIIRTSKAELNATLNTYYRTSRGDGKPFVKPKDAVNSYPKGARMTYNGKTYQSLVDFNLWSPDEFAAAWTEVTYVTPPSDVSSAPATALTTETV